MSRSQKVKKKDSCGCSRGVDAYANILEEEQLNEFKEFLTKNHGQVVEMYGHALVIVNGTVVDHTKGGKFTIPGLNIGNVEIVIGTNTNTTSSNRVRSTAPRTGGEVSGGPETATVKEIKNIDVVFNTDVKPDFKAKVQEALATALERLNSKNLGWVAGSTIYVECLCSRDLSGVYYPSTDNVYLTDYDTGRIHYTIVHEFGHRFHYRCRDTYGFDEQIANAYNDYMRSGGRAFPSAYSRTDRYEWFAESFRYWCYDTLDGYDHTYWLGQLIRKHNR